MLFNYGKSLAARVILILTLLGGMFGIVWPKQALAAPGDLTRISVSSDGVQANDDSESASLSGNGQYIAFHSSATNLVTGDTNGTPDIFLRDIQNGSIRRVSVSSAGAQANKNSSRPSISSDGRYIVYESWASNLVSGDANNNYDIFMYDTQAAATIRVSVASDGAQGNSNSYFPQISADGRYVIFYSEATNLVSGDTNGYADVFVRDLLNATTTRVSLTTDGTQANRESLPSFISADGRYIVFSSPASNLASGDIGFIWDVFVRDTQTNTTSRVSVDSSGNQGNNNSYGSAISADGRYVIFRSAATNLIAGDTNGVDDVFLHDRQSSTTIPVSYSNGLLGNGGSFGGVITADGKYIVFSSNANNLVNADSNSVEDVFIYDRETTQIVRVSLSTNGIQGNQRSYSPVISSDGKYVAFTSIATNLVENDSNGMQDILLRENGISILPEVRVVSKTTDTNDGVCDSDCSLREAIQSAASGAIINFDLSLAGQTITLESNLVIGQNLIIDGSGLSPQITINGGNISHLEISFDVRVTISDLTITNGSYGILSNGDLKIINSTLKDNVGVAGGAVYSYGPSLTIENSTITQNRAYYNGGAIFVGGAGIASIVNSTIIQNQSDLWGGGIYIGEDAAVEIINSTFAENTAPNGSEISITGSTANLTVSNSIFACAPANSNCYDYSPNVVTSTNSIISVGTLADFGLSILAENGGPTQTMALLSESSLIDAGNDSICANSLVNNLDQRGVTRPQGVHCDIGAYEFQARVISPGDTIRVSVDSSGVQANNDSSMPTISADGRYIAFESFATNLVSGDTNGAYDVFVRDVQTGTTRRISVDSSGAQGDGSSYDASISADGRYIAFGSSATNLVAGDTNGMIDIFVHDMQTGMTTRASVDSNGVQANNDSHFSSISADGRYIAFMSYATNLVPGDTNGMEDVFVHDRQTGITTRASVDSNGIQGNSSSYESSISADGHYIAFASYATNLVAGDTNGVWDIFVHDRQTGMTTRASVNSNGAQGDNSSNDPSISADGRYIAFFSNATNLVSGDTNGWYDIFMHDMQTGMTTRASVDSSGVQGNQDSAVASVSADGRYIAFRSQATNLVSGDTNGVDDIFVRDIQTGLTTRVSVSTSDVQGDGHSSDGIISADGRFIAFTSYAANLVAGDTNAATDVFVHRQDILSVPPTPIPTYTPTFTPTSTPTDTPTPTPTNTPTPTQTFTPTSTPSYSYNPLYLSLTGNQTIGGVSSADEDILRFDGQNWSLLFDGSDVGVASPDLFGFSVVDADTILMAFSSAVTVNGLAVAPQDVVQFDATSLGSNTAGTFSMYLDGSDVGLDTTAEKIDSVGLLPDGRVLISTTGNPSVPGIAGKDEDVLVFTPTSLGNVTSGTWSMYFDGSDVGLAETSGEDVDALDVTSDGNIYLSTADNFTVNGVAGADEDVFVCQPTALGDVTDCNYSSALYFDGSTWGLSANDVDAFHLLTIGSVSTATPTSTPSNTPTNTPTRTPSPTPTFTRTPTATPTAPRGVFEVTIVSHEPHPSNIGEAVTITVSVTDVGGGPAGSVMVDVVSDEGSTSCTTSELSSMCSSQLTFNNPFGHLITASVGGDMAQVDHYVYPPATHTSTPTDTPTVADLIFADGFESGNLSAWSSSTTDLGDLSVTGAVALVGNQGLQAVIDDATAIYLTDDTPNAEPRYRARFYFDPNSIPMASGDAHFIFKGFTGTSTEVLRLEFRNSSGSYQLRALLLNDGTTWTYSSWFPISDAPHFIELDWRAATAAGANNGALTLWIDGIQQADLVGVDNDTRRIDRVRLGALSGIDTGTRGAYYFDAFESRRESHIGP